VKVRQGFTQLYVLLKALISLAMVLVSFPEQVFAHGVPTGGEPPLPAWLFAWSAVLILVLSFFVLSIRWRLPRWQSVSSGRAVLVVPGWLQFLLGLLGCGVYCLLIYAGIFGTQIVSESITPTFIYVLFWVGFAFASPLLGDVFSFVNPWRSIARAGSALYSKVGKKSVSEPIKYPEALGYWPATVGLLCFVWLELVSPNGSDPSNLAVAALIYGLVQLVGISLFGEATWTKRGDGFSVYFRTLSLLSPLNWDEGELRVSKPLVRVTRFKSYSGSLALIGVLLGSTLFDGLLGGRVWAEVVPSLQDVVVSIGLSSEQSLVLVNSGGLAGASLVVIGIYCVGVKGVHKVGSSLSFKSLSNSFVHTLVPIILVYVMAHYLTLLVTEGQALIPLVSDPLGSGLDLFKTASFTPNYGLLPTSVVWYLQATFLICGHVLAAVLAHDRSLALFKNFRTAVLSQYWMLAVMVLFTTLGMWLLSAASY